MAILVHYIQSMSGYKAISLKKQQRSKYNLGKHQFRGNLKIKNSWISSKRLVGIESNLSQKILPGFLNHKPLSELLKNFSSIHSLLYLRGLWDFQADSMLLSIRKSWGLLLCTDAYMYSSAEFKYFVKSGFA